MLKTLEDLKTLKILSEYLLADKHMQTVHKSKSTWCNLIFHWCNFDHLIFADFNNELNAQDIKFHCQLSGSKSVYFPSLGE